MLEFEDNIKNFDENIGQFDNYTHEGDSYINETGIPCPNLGFYSAKLFSSGNHSAVVEKAIELKPEAFISLWINFEKISSNKTYIPILKDDIFDVVSIIAYKDDDLVKIGINVSGEMEWLADSEIKMNEWYNLKVHINVSEVELSYRSKECGSWQSLVRESHELNSIEISGLCLGICSSDESLVYVDDYYYHPTEIDAVSYINGAFSIYDKNSLEKKSQMHLNIRPNAIAVHNNFLFLCCLRGINVYDISNPDNPILVDTYREKTEFHGCDIFEKDDKTYLVVSIYTKGTAIFDVTNPFKIRLVKKVAIRSNTDWEKCYTFDVVCKYPYAYSTLTVAWTEMFTDKDRRGVLCLDLSDLNNIKQVLYEIPEDVKSDITTADNQPNSITKYRDKLILNNSVNGMLIFDIDETGVPQYNSCQSVPSNSAINAVSAFSDGSLFAGDTKSGSEDYPDYGIYWFQFVEKESVYISIPQANKWSTCILPFACELPEGLKAYTCSSKSDAKKVFYLGEAISLEAFTPYVLYSENGYTGTLTGEVDASLYPESGKVTVGFLTGAVTEQTTNEGYILQKQNGVVKFYIADPSKTYIIPAGRCWATPPTNSVQSYGFSFESTEVNNITESADNKNENKYNINGVIIKEPQSGTLYLQNGYKLIR
jgi:hypothetical protein